MRVREFRWYSAVPGIAAGFLIGCGGGGGGYGGGMTAGAGPSATSARVIAHGGGFNAPLSAALLADGDLVVANSDLNNPVQTPNLLFEISPVLPGGFVGQPVQLDNGAPAALFGLATTVDAQGHQLVYFNDDNPNPANSNPPINYVMLLSQ
jgi:hypothetical protein